MFKQLLSKFYQKIRTRYIKKDWKVIEMYLDKRFLLPYSKKDPFTIVGYLSLTFMLICLKSNIDGHIKPPLEIGTILMIGLPYMFFYLVSVIYLFNYKIN